MSISNQCGCRCTDCNPKDNNNKVLIIGWQRLMSNGKTCPRCGSTESELDKAIAILDNALKSMGIKVELQKTELSLEDFKKNSEKSNMIFFNGIPMEELIEAETGHSQCCDVCGDEECRTVEVGGKSYEVIPSDMIVKAGLIAGAKMC